MKDSDSQAFCRYVLHLKVASIKITNDGAAVFRNWGMAGDGLSYLSAFLPQLGIVQVIGRNGSLAERKGCDNLGLRVAVWKPERT